MQSAKQIHNLLFELLSDLQQTALLWQMAALALSLGLGWWLGRFAKQRFAVSPAVGEELPSALAARQFVGGFNRAVFPLTALALVLIAKALMRHSINVNLLNLAVPLLLSLALIRLSIYVLRNIFAPSGWLHTSERFIAGLIWVGVALHITGFLPEIAGVLDELDFTVGKQRVSLLLASKGVVTIAVTVLIAMWLGKLLESRFMRAEQLDMNVRVLASKFLRALFLVAAVLVALPALGIDVTVLSVFGGALGVGLGFGLQKIASNYVSGFIILLDKSIHLGDIITVDNRYGSVSRLTARYTVLKALDGTEAIIPNDTLITSTVVNHSYSDRKVMAAIPVQISYGSPLEDAMQIMLQAARHNPRVIDDPEPKVYLREFADNGINLELKVWITDPEEGQLSLRSDINLDIWREFQRRGVEIPYPQRDVRIVGQSAQSLDLSVK